MAGRADNAVTFGAVLAIEMTTWSPVQIQATVLRDFTRRVYLATYGDPPDPPATTAFITALHHAVQQTQPGEPTPPTTNPAPTNINGTTDDPAETGPAEAHLR